MNGESDFAFRHPMPNKARRLIREALALAHNGELVESVPLFERAIRLDQINALNAYCALRAEVVAALGDRRPTLAIEFYMHAIHCKKSGRFRDAKLAYLEAHALDPVFLWPANNYAWLLATSTEPVVRNGEEAIKYAMLACELSRWRCWAFISTLAAAYAEFGEFQKAVGWQTSALEMAPSDHRMDAIIQLRHYQSNHAYIDEGTPVAAGQ